MYYFVVICLATKPLFSLKPLENQKDQIVEQQWPESQPIIWQNEERRRSKQIRKEYFKVPY